MKQHGKTFRAGSCMIVETIADHLECWLKVHLNFDNSIAKVRLSSFF